MIFINHTKNTKCCGNGRLSKGLPTGNTGGIYTSRLKVLLLYYVAPSNKIFFLI